MRRTVIAALVLLALVLAPMVRTLRLALLLALVAYALQATP